MAALGKRWRKQSSHVNEIDGPVKSCQEADATPKRNLTDKENLNITPNKQLEEQVLCECSEYLTNNLPADDVAPVMLTRNLLTAKEYDEYKTMKRSGRSTMAVMSEYLLECLRRRQAGFLREFCRILKNIEAAKYLGDYIHQSYREINNEGFNTTSRDRLSKISLSDPDIRPKTPLGNPAIPCNACKELKKRIRRMQRQNSELTERLCELEKDHQQLQEAKIKVEGQLEILHDQLGQEESERKCLRQIVPHLQEAIISIETNCRRESPAGTSGAQQTLRRISDLIHNQGKGEKLPIVVKRGHHLIRSSDTSKRDSTLSTYSDTSSVTESSLADEDRATDVIERNQPSTDFNRSAVIISDLHKSVTQNQMKSEPDVMNMNQNEPIAQTALEVAGIKESSSTVFTDRIQKMESSTESREGHTRSEYFPVNNRTRTMPTKSYLSSRTKLRHSSESRVQMRQHQSQSSRPDTYQQRPLQAMNNTLRTHTEDHNSQLFADELSVVLSKRREKIDSESSVKSI